MASFVIEGGHRLCGEIHPQGAKNEVLQIICARLLTAEEVTVNNIPDIKEMLQSARLCHADWPYGGTFRQSVDIQAGRR